MPLVGFEPTISVGERPVCDLQTSRIGASYIYDNSNLRVKDVSDCKHCKVRRILLLRSF
jgi:hypothetical protein